MLSTLPGSGTLAAQTGVYKRSLANASEGGARTRRRRDRHRPLGLYRRHRPAGRAETEEAIVRHIATSAARAPAAISARFPRWGVARSKYDDLAETLLHGSAETVIARLREMQARTGMTSLLLHYPPYYGRKTMKSLKLFAERAIPAFRPPAWPRRNEGRSAAGALAQRSRRGLYGVLAMAAFAVGTR